MSILVLADHDQGKLSPATQRVLGAVATLGDAADVLVAGENIGAVAEAAAKLPGVQKVSVADNAAYASQSAEALAGLLAGLVDGYDYIVASAGAVGRDVMPRLAAKLDLMPVTDVIAIHGADRFDRPVYAGNAIETVVNTQAKKLLTIRASAFAPLKGDGQAPIEPVSLANIKSVVEFIAELRTENDTPDLGTAQIVVGGGQSFASAENFKMVEKLAAVLGAAVGATRAAVDAGYAPNDWQVGQTGKIIAPDLYIAIGISGALQHLAGIQGAKKIIAINLDPEAPLVKLADLALIGDLFEVVPALTAALEQRLKA